MYRSDETPAEILARKTVDGHLFYRTFEDGFGPAVGGVVGQDAHQDFQTARQRMRFGKGPKARCDGLQYAVDEVGSHRIPRVGREVYLVIAVHPVGAVL